MILQSSEQAPANQAETLVDTGLVDVTSFFLSALTPKLPTNRRVRFVTVPIFGFPGFGKTYLATALAIHVISKYGRDQVDVRASQHLPDLVDALRSLSRPVTVLLVEGIGDLGRVEATQRAEALFARVRQGLERADDVENRLVIVLYTSQTYKGTANVFRQGIPVFKSSLGCERDEIRWENRLGDKADAYLERLTQEVMIHGRDNRRQEGLVKLPGYPEGTVRTPISDSALLAGLLAEVDNDEARRAMEGGAVERMYAVLRKAWTIDGRIDGGHPGQVDGLVNEFLADHLERSRPLLADDVGASVVLEWLDERMFRAADEAEYIMSADAYLHLTRPKWVSIIKRQIVESLAKNDA